MFLITLLIYLCLNRSRASDGFKRAQILRAVFLTGFLGFFRLSNVVPHSLTSLDLSRHLICHDLFFSHKLVKIMIKWSKIMQNRDAVQVISLSKLKNQLIRPFRALKALSTLYPMSATTSVFQVHSALGWGTFTDTKIRKCLEAINMTLGFNPHFFTFHSFRRSGATFAYNCHVSIQHII